jgi:hypothetical protein
LRSLPFKLLCHQKNDGTVRFLSSFWLCLECWLSDYFRLSPFKLRWLQKDIKVRKKRILIFNLCLTSWSLTNGINRLYHNASKEEEYQRQGAFIQFCYWRLVWFQSILTQFLKMPIWCTALEEEGKMLGDAILLSTVLDKLIPYKRSCPLSSHCSQRRSRTMPLPR